MDIKTLQRFFDKVEFSNVSGGCWIWTGALKSHKPKYDYGHFGLDGRPRPTHRLMFQWQNGPITPEVHVCHKCDTPRCVNPAHLFAGTHLTNNRDCAAKGRNRYPDNAGEKHGNAKLTSEKVLAIRNLAASGLTRKAISDIYGVSSSLVTLVVQRKYWRHI